jgi:NAD(P)-dependent dehydrogenase (short-subunit alcohol dehydrogenase family)
MGSSLPEFIRSLNVQPLLRHNSGANLSPVNYYSKNAPTVDWALGLAKKRHSSIMVPSPIESGKTAMHTATYGLNRRSILQAAVAGAALSPLPAFSAICSGPQPRPEGELAYSDFGVASTAEEVTHAVDLKGKTALITGCNSGLGFETMRVLSARGAQVIGVARTLEKAEKACASVAGPTIPMAAELSNFASVTTCAESVAKLNTPVDMLICNAGIMALPELTLSQDLELQFVVNHLGHFHLTTRLLDQVKAADDGRIVILSSCAHQLAPPAGIDFDNLDGSKSYSGWVAYGRSKLANGLFALELSRRLGKGSSVTANAVHPGVINTNLGRHLPDSDKAQDDSSFDKNIAQGAATQCYVAANPIPAQITGQYFVDCNPAQANPKMYDPALATELWEVSEKLIAERLV